MTPYKMENKNGRHLVCHQCVARGAVKYEMDTGVRAALRQAGAFSESTGSKNEGSLGESMIFGIQWEKNTKICGVIGWEQKYHKKVGSLGVTLKKKSIVRVLPGILFDGALSDRLNAKIWVFGCELMQL